MQLPKYELNLALIPQNDLAHKLTAASHSLAARHPTVIQLGSVEPRLAFAPHLTLYQVAIAHDYLVEALDALKQLAQTSKTLTLRATCYAYNADEASYEVRYEAADPLLQLQDNLIANINPLRHGLLVERDPAGNNVSSLLKSTGVLGDNLRKTGFAEVGDPAKGGLFRPHVTLNWFQHGTAAGEHDPTLPAIDSLDGAYIHLGVYLLGPYGTCTQRIAQYPLG